MNFKCFGCGADIPGIIPIEWPYENIFPVTCQVCHKQQIITAKGLMEWGEVLGILNLAFTTRGVNIGDIRNVERPVVTAETTYANPEEPEKKPEGELDPLPPVDINVTNIADWKKRRKK